MSSIVDAEGNINASYLTKELKQALEEDVRYKQTDNMKKRAVKVSTDYNEFKAMVACAHLKKLTSKEVESLSHVKKGWQRSVQKDTTGSAVILTKEATEPLEPAGKFVGLPSSTQKPKPKSAMEIERDLRREASDSQQLLYLLRVGMKKAKALLSIGADTDLIEKIVRLLIQEPLHGWSLPIEKVEKEAEPPSTPPTLEQPESNATLKSNSATAARVEKTDEELLSDLKLRVKWLKGIAEFDKFDLTKRFMQAALLESVSQFLTQSPDPDVASVIAKYSVK